MSKKSDCLTKIFQLVVKLPSCLRNNHCNFWWTSTQAARYWTTFLPTLIFKTCVHYNTHSCYSLTNDTEAKACCVFCIASTYNVYTLYKVDPATWVELTNLPKVEIG